jgi:hypothetical protein
VGSVTDPYGRILGLLAFPNYADHREWNILCRKWSYSKPINEILTTTSLKFHNNLMDLECEN